MGSIRRQGTGRPAGVLRKNLYVVLAVLAVSGAAGFLAPLYISQVVYGVPWRNSDDTLVNISERGTPQATPTWAKPGMPQVRVNFWVTSTAMAETAALDAASATALRPSATPTATLATPTPTRRTKIEPTSTRRPKEPTSTPRPPRPTNTKAPPPKPTNTSAPPPSPEPTQGVLPTQGAGGAPAYAAMQPPAAGAPWPAFLWQAAAHLWSLLRGLLR